MKNITSGYRSGFILLLAWGITLPIGCSRQPTTSTWNVTEPAAYPTTTQAAASDQYDLLMPAQIEILPFSKPKSWDSDQIPDGVEVVLRPLDSFGDQTKAVGLFRFELYLFQKASSDPRGQRIGFWEENLMTRQSQLLHWDRITRTYRFRLSLAGQSVRPGKDVLEVTYLSPTGTRLGDNYTVETTLPREQIKEEIERERQDGLKLF